MVNENTFYLLHNSIYLFAVAVNMWWDSSVKFKSSAASKLFWTLNSKMGELTMVFQTERLFFPLTIKDFKPSISNSTLQGKMKCGKWLVTFFVCGRHICKSYKKCLSFCNKVFVLQPRMQNISQLEKYHIH